MGFDHIVLPKGNLRSMKLPDNVTVYGAETVYDALRTLGLLQK